MLKFPKGAVASCAGESLADQECVVSLRLADDFDRIDEYKKLYGKRILFFETEGKNLSAGGELEAFAGERVRIRAKKSDIAFIGEAHDRFVTMKPVFLVEPGDDLFKMVNFLSGFGFRIHISPAVPVGNPEELERILDFYFHSPLVSAPIEPFHTLLHTEVKKRRITLWDTEYELSLIHI